jgi:hypothetical protein
MTAEERDMPPFNFPSPERQLFIRDFLDAARQTGLHDALRRAVRKMDAATLRAELVRFAPAAGLQVIQGTGVRDEEVFATPALLRAAPGVLTYYRLLLGVSQKAFYATSSGLGKFRSMEERRVIRGDAEPDIERLCTELNLAMSRLLAALPGNAIRQDVLQLPLMTLGAQADGAWRGKIGQKATAGVFATLKAIITTQVQGPVDETEISVTVKNSAGRCVTLTLASDPDIVIRESVNGQDVYKTAIEIKGGTDYANLHNRAGEAEKSHTKAHNKGAQDCWTVIDLKNADISRLKQESPSTRQWFDLTEILERSGPSYTHLVALMISAMGI